MHTYKLISVLQINEKTSHFIKQLKMHAQENQQRENFKYLRNKCTKNKYHFSFLK